jgi:hypothetical protein
VERSRPAGGIREISQTGRAETKKVLKNLHRIEKRPTDKSVKRQRHYGFTMNTFLNVLLALPVGVAFGYASHRGKL